uniref:Glycosyl transferase n=1 Tax=uncultured Prevotella sp. TaxID=159272 RepID=A0A6G8F1K9_9BACT|nr:glycosyl transferase [uncultured Prevotella sp.]
MRILHISKYYFPYMGGVENICKYLVERMPWHTTSVVCFNDGKENAVDDVNGHRVYRAGAFVSIARQALSLSYKNGLQWAMLAEKPEVIQFHWANPFPAILLRMVIPKDVKLVVHWHMDIIRQWYLYWAIRPWERWLIKRADRIVVTSPQYRDGSKPLQGVKDKVRIVPNAIDSDVFELQPGDDMRIKEIKEKYSGKPIVFFMGRHTKYKGLPHLIEAERYMQTDCVIVIGGNGPLTDKLKAQAERRGTKRINFVGRLSDDDLRCYLYAASVFAFPSVTKNEAFGVALAEAMYCKTPAVTFTIKGSGVNWVNLNGITGIEVSQGKDQDLLYAQALDTLLADRELQTRYAETAHERVAKNFLIEHMVEAMENVYKEIVT